MVQYLHVVDLVLPQLWCVNSIFLFDSHSRNIDGFNDPNGRAVLFKFRTMMPLKNFIKSFFENCTGVSLETQHDLKYIGKQISNNLKEEILQSLQRKRKSLHNKVYQTETNRRSNFNISAKSRILLT